MMTTLAYFIGNGLCLGADILVQVWVSHKERKARISLETEAATELESDNVKDETGAAGVWTPTTSTASSSTRPVDSPREAPEIHSR
mmetsp:Transcript_10504/g.9527  ORF Transcript_10504/g.9527 Transcript_10504/m.9527 type:complete len:86 (-) Transcript_10504:11-268(-)